jgi:predicted alpha/beta-hydrolase family hydrolase
VSAPPPTTASARAGHPIAAWDAPTKRPRAVLVLAHGAGSDHRAPLLAYLAQRLPERGIAVVRFDFGYRIANKKLPAPMATIVPEWAAVVAAVRERAPRVPIFIGGKSMGGRAATHLAVESRGASVRGVVLLGYPLHPAGKPEKLRDAHLPDVRIPMLFVSGTRDELCDLSLFRPVLARCGDRAKLHVLPDGDHGLEVRKTIAGRSTADAWTEVEGVIASFIGAVRSG